MRRSTRPPIAEGQQFGHWTVVRRLPRIAGAALTSLCRCSCGRESAVRNTNLRSQHSTSCLKCSQARRGKNRIGVPTSRPSTAPVPPGTFKTIIEQAALQFGVPYSDIIGIRLSRPESRARYAAMWIAWRVTNASYPVIASAFDRRNADTVYTGLQQAKRLIKKDSAFASNVLATIRAFKAHQQIGAQ